MKKLELQQMEMIEGGTGNKYALAVCGAIITTMEYSIINPIWAAFHLSAAGGCLMYAALS